MSIEVRINFGPLGNARLDMTEELMQCADIIGQEIRGDINRGVLPTGEAIRSNAPSVAAAKMGRTTKRYLRTTKTHQAGTIRVAGQAKPLIDIYKKLVAPSSYVKLKMAVNHVKLRLTNAIHPGTNISIAHLGAILHNGNSGIPKRPFFGVSAIAKKRILAYITDRIYRLLKK